MPSKNREDRLAASKRHYESHKRDYILRNYKAVAKKREYIKTQKDVPCMDCNIKYPYYVMDFDHNGDKLFNIAKMATQSWRQIKEEIAKCDVVCSNCHRLRTHKRMED